MCCLLVENKKKTQYDYMGHHLYRNINIFMEYTGKILIGKGFKINIIYIWDIKERGHMKF